MASSFVPRAAFPILESVPRSYFLGHHRAGLSKMKTMLSNIDMIIECRDYRIPLTSRNPLFEESLAGRERLIVYTKKDLGTEGGGAERRREEIVRRWHPSSQVLFSDHRDKQDVKRVLQFAKAHSKAVSSLTGSRMMVVGMPNVGKSSLLNALRQIGVHRGKAAYTGAQPGITRKIATGVKIIEGTEGEEGVYLLDTPGVFMPYVPNAEAMLKLALCGSVKDTVVPPVTLADYLLFRLNLSDPNAYARYHHPTNEIITFLNSVARQTGRLQKGGTPDLESTALWIIQKWRRGEVGKLVLDEVTEDAFERTKKDNEEVGGSLNQARRLEKEGRRERSRLKQLEA
ncbi:MAG: Mitochondrial GTPase [Sclerophora amabilis]|nr:MAG: Mitochondrial GTPase [Sclerophora amabilis]